MDIYVSSPPQHIKKEREKARRLRKTHWWASELHRGICYYCDQKFSRKELTMDHKVPLSRGGKSTRGNVVPCCKSCNTKKKSKTSVEILLERL